MSLVIGCGCLDGVPREAVLPWAARDRHVGEMSTRRRAHVEATSGGGPADGSIGVPQRGCFLLRENQFSREVLSGWWCWTRRVNWLGARWGGRGSSRCYVLPYRGAIRHLVVTRGAPGVDRPPHPERPRHWGRVRPRTGREEPLTGRSVAVDVTALGEEVSDFEVTFDVEDEATVSNTTAELGLNETETVTFEHVTGDPEAGNYTVTVSTVDDELTGDFTRA